MPKKVFGLPKGDFATFAKGNGDREFEERYPEDKYGEEAGPSARVWRLYMDEALVVDARLVDEARDTLDVLLVFGGLFSAIVTAFLAQTYQSLQPDFTEISTSLLFEMVSLQRAGLNETAIAAVPHSPVTPLTPFHATGIDTWINSLWFVSLLIGLLVAIVAVLVKQWLHHYRALPSGTFCDRVIERQRRFDGLETWRVHTIVGILPVLMHLALVMFLVGLTMFLISLSRPLAIVVGLFTVIIVFAYVAANAMPYFYPDCPYRTPLTTLLGPACFLASRAFNFAAISSKVFVPELLRLTLRTSRDIPPPSTTSSSRIIDQLLTKSLAWLYATSSNPAERRVVLEGISGLPLAMSSSSALTHLEGIVTDPYITECLRPVQYRNATGYSYWEVVPEPHIEDRLERLLRAEVFLGKPSANRALLASDKWSPRLKFSFEVMEGHDNGTKSFLSLIGHCVLPETDATFTPLLWYNFLNSAFWLDSEPPGYSLAGGDTWNYDTLFGLLQKLFDKDFVDDHAGDEWDSLVDSDFGAARGMTFACFRRDMYAQLLIGLAQYDDLDTTRSAAPTLEEMHIHVLLTVIKFLITQLEPGANIHLLRSKAWALNKYHGLLRRLLDRTKKILFPTHNLDDDALPIENENERVQWIKLAGKILSQTIIFPDALLPQRDQEWLHGPCHSAIPEHVTKHTEVDVATCLDLESIQKDFFCILDNVYSRVYTDAGPLGTSIASLKRGLHHFGISTIKAYHSKLSGTQVLAPSPDEWEGRIGYPVLRTLFICLTKELDGSVEDAAAMMIEQNIIGLCLPLCRRNRLTFWEMRGCDLLWTYVRYLQQHPKDTTGRAYIKSFSVQELADLTWWTLEESEEMINKLR